MSSHHGDDRICYYVFGDNGIWAAEFDGQRPPIHFPNREAALDAAREAAETRWRMAGIPSCVRIGPPEGTSVEDTTYG